MTRPSFGRSPATVTQSRSKSIDPEPDSECAPVPISERFPMPVIAGLHPTLLDLDTLREQTELRTQRRSGPGGQHRNKTSSGVFLAHAPSGLIAEATERRSQAENRAVALLRLRFKLAVEIRTASICDGEIDQQERQFRQRFRGGGLRVAESNPAKPALLALLLNDLHACGGQPRLVAPLWQTTASAMVRLIKTHPPAMRLLQSIRDHHQLRPLS